MALAVQGKNYTEQRAEFDVKADETARLNLVLTSIWKIPPRTALSAKQGALISDYLKLPDVADWPDLAEPEQTTFLAITHAIDQVHISSKKTALDLIDRVEKIVGDPSQKLKDNQVFRLYVAFNKDFKGWIESGAKYKDRKGRELTTVGAPGHPGYPKSQKTHDGRPNLQWSFTKDFKRGDLDLDGKPFLAHLTRENSDVREFYDDYKRKYGNPGFTRR